MDVNQAQQVVLTLLDMEKNKKGYGVTYDTINKQVERILPHADPDYVPLRLIENRAPNATDEQVKYIKKNWKATTSQVFQELLTVINRGFIDDNWNILWDEDSEDFKKYCDETFPEYGSTETLIKEIVPPIKYTDANAIIAVRPRGFVYLRDDKGQYLLDDDGSLILDDTQRLEPAVYFHPSSRVLIRHDEFYLVVSNEYSEVQYNGNTVKEGRVLFIYTKNDIYKVEQYGKKIDNLYRTFLYYNHNEGVIPAIEVGGIPKKTDDGIIQVSPYRYATDLLDLALTNKNWLQLSVSTVVFPFRIMMADSCTYANDKGQCHNGVFSSKSDGMSLGSCPSCNGSGNNVPYSPLGVYLWDKDDAEKRTSSLKPVEFVEAPVTSIEFVDALVTKDTASAKEILHLEKSNTQVKGNENTTATGMVLNDQAQISFVRYNVHQIFNLWSWVLNRVSYQRYENYNQVPTLVYPQTFDFRSEADIWEQIKLARESEAPVSIIQDLFKSLMNNIHSSSPKAQKIYDTIVNADKLFGLSDMALASRKAAGTVQNWEVTLHDSATQLVNQLIREDENYLDKDIQERIDLLVELSKISTFELISTNPVDGIINGGQAT
jgi:hypothetical protein